MHILLIHQAFVSPNEAGGTRHYELARHLVQQGHQVTIVASDLSYLSGQRTTARPKLVTQEFLDGIQVLRAYTYPALHRSFFWRVISFFSFMFTSLVAALRVKNVDLIMGTSPPIFQALSAWVVAAFRRLPLLLEIRDLWPEFAIDMGVLKSRLLIKLSRCLEAFLYRKADHFVVNSPAYRDYLIGKGIPKEGISFISNGVDTEMFHPDKNGQRVRQQWGLESKFVVTYTGALGMANDIPTILRAAERLQRNKDIIFLVVGDGKERKNLEEAAYQKNLLNVRITGSVTKAEMPEVIAASDICVATLQNIPMFKTVYPNKVFDYMAAGKPTILAIDGVIRKVVEEAKGGVFVPPGDDATLANTVLDLKADRQCMRAMGAAARSYAVEHFDRLNQAEQFLKLVCGFGKRDN